MVIVLMTDVSVHELLTMVHTTTDDGSGPVEDPSGAVDIVSSLAVPPTPSDANEKIKSSSKPRREKPVSDGGHTSETLKRPADNRIHRYSPFGAAKPTATARVQRMVEKAQREFDQATPPYHSKHSRPAIPTAAAMRSVQMGNANMEHVVRDGVPEGPPFQLPGQPKRRPSMVGTPYPKPMGGGSQSRVKTQHDRLIDAEFNRDVSQCLVVHGGRALGLERSRCETTGLKALVEKNISSFETQSDAMKLVCLLIAKKLNQITEGWVGVE